eukprot:c3749_g1_i1 orf=72-761(+)
MAMGSLNLPLSLTSPLPCVPAAQRRAFALPLQPGVCCFTPFSSSRSLLQLRVGPSVRNRWQPPSSLAAKLSSTMWCTRLLRQDVCRRSNARAVENQGLNIRSARVGGIEIPNSKRIEASLQYIHGIGQTTARKILFNVGLLNKVTKELTEEELAKIRDEISNNRVYKIEGDLRRDVNNDIRRLKDIQCYRGRRHTLNLPCRGQQTQCNGRTRKGRRVAVAGKKKIPSRG